MQIFCFWGGQGGEDSMCSLVSSEPPPGKKWLSSPCQVGNSWCKLTSRIADSMKSVWKLVKQPKSEHSLWFNDSWVKVLIVLITSCTSVVVMWYMHTYSFAVNNFSSDFHTGWFGCYLTSVFSCSCLGLIFVAVVAEVKSSLIFSEILQGAANVLLDVLLK